MIRTGYGFIPHIYKSNIYPPPSKNVFLCLAPLKLLKSLFSVTLRTGDGYKPLIAAKPSIENQSGKKCFDSLAKHSDSSTQPLLHDRKHYRKLINPNYIGLHYLLIVWGGACTLSHLSVLVYPLVINIFF